MRRQGAAQFRLIGTPPRDARQAAHPGAAGKIVDIAAAQG